ncbi:hypothetical protein SAMCFNEI73_pC1636 (plasmid) [Sinorhizobium americanum]|uniref:Uncharacterized protein n=1 Tax=Sinorhizobium americanum TaxID=194963 RepID=A0A1L3LZ22_9HYPH|nr:hypothetical protein SAMCFNEI73_pC1636 [Sinorhizobium americanum]
MDPNRLTAHLRVQLAPEDALALSPRYPGRQRQAREGAARKK